MKIGIRRKLLRIYLLVTIPLIGIIAYVLLHYYQDRQNDLLRDQLASANQSASIFAQYVEGIANIAKIHGRALEGISVSDPDLPSHLRAVVEVVDAKNVFLADNDGKIAAVDAEDANIWQDIIQSLDSRPSEQGWRLSNLKQTASGIEFAVAARNEPSGRVIGIVLTPRVLEARLQPAEPGGEIAVTDATGRLAFQTRHPDLSWQERDWRDYLFVQTALSGYERAVRSVQFEGDRDPRLGAMAPAKPTQWTVGYFVPALQVRSHVQAEAVRTSAIIVGIILTSLLLGLWFTSRIVRPIVSLAESVRAIGRGSFSVPIRVTTGDEIEALSSRLSEMQHNLKVLVSGLEELVDIGKSVTAHLDLPTVEGRITQALRSIVGAESAAIYHYTERTSEFSESSVEEAEIEFDARLAEKALAEKKILNDLRGRLLYLPLVSESQKIGVLIASLQNGEIETSPLMPLLESFAQQATIAIENAMLYQEQVGIAETLQESLLTSPPALSGFDLEVVYKPVSRAAKVGGDFYDLGITEEGKIFFFIGDVSGKGIEAATLTGLAKNTLRAFLTEDRSPAAVLKKANRAIYEQGSSEQFITAFLGIFDPKTNALTYSNAGHLAPYIKLASNEAVKPLHTGGQPLGITNAYEFGDETMQLELGDTIFLYTDGVTETRKNRELYGIERLENLLRHVKMTNSKDLAQAITTDLTRFSSNHLADDIALVILRRTG